MESFWGEFQGARNVSEEDLSLISRKAHIIARDTEMILTSKIATQISKWLRLREIHGSEEHEEHE